MKEKKSSVERERIRVKNRRQFTFNGEWFSGGPEIEIKNAEMLLFFSIFVCWQPPISHRKQLWNNSKPRIENRLSRGGLHKKATRRPRMGSGKARNEKFFLPLLLLLRDRREKTKKKPANEAKWLALSSFNSLDGLGLFFFIPSWLIVGSLGRLNVVGCEVVSIWSCEQNQPRR